MENDAKERDHKIAKIAMKKRVNEFKFGYEEAINRYSTVIFNSEAKRAIKERAINLQRLCLKKYEKEVIDIDIEIGWEYQEQLRVMMSTAIANTEFLTTFKEGLCVIGGLTLLVLTGSFVAWLVTWLGKEASLAAIKSLIQFYLANKSSHCEV